MQTSGRVDDLVGLATTGGMAGQAVTICTGRKTIIPAKRSGIGRLAVVTLVGAGLVAGRVARRTIRRTIPDFVKTTDIRRRCGGTAVIVVATTGTVRIIVTVITHLLLLGVSARQGKAELGREAGDVDLVLTGAVGISPALRPVISTAAMTGITAGIYARTGHRLRIPPGLSKGVLPGGTVSTIIGRVTGRTTRESAATAPVGAVVVHGNKGIAMVAGATPVGQANLEGVAGIASRRAKGVTILTLIVRTGIVGLSCAPSATVGPVGDPTVPAVGPVTMATGALSAIGLIRVLVPLALPGSAGPGLIVT